MLTAERLRQMLDYDPNAGVFRWRDDRSSNARAGDIAGCRLPSGGYWRISFGQKSFMAHRLAWLYVHGEWPSRQIDHIDCNRLNNAISNLRLATPSQNGGNQLLLRRNSSGFKGAVKHGKRWQSSICFQGRTIYLGRFDTGQQAHAAYIAAAQRLHGEFARAA